MADDDEAMIHVRRSTAVRVGIAGAVLVAVGIGFAIGYAVHSPTTAPAKNAAATKNGDEGTYQHFFENSKNPSATTQVHKTVIPGNAITTTTLPITSTTILPATATPTVATAVVPNAVIPGGSTVGIAVLRQAGFTYWIAYQPVSGCPNEGTVLSQTPLAGSTAPVGSTVLLTVEKC